MGDVVEALKLGERAGVVVEQHAGIGERAATHVLDREAGEIAGVVVEAEWRRSNGVVVPIPTAPSISLR